MMENSPHKLIFLTLIRTAQDAHFVHLLVESIRSFGGDLSQCPVWIFATHPVAAGHLPLENGHIFPLAVPENVAHYFFADKVFACAQAEAMAGPGVQSLVWIDPECLVVQPPALFDLGTLWDTAVRPVHIKNVGLAPEEPLNLFWQKVYGAVGLDDVQLMVETFVGQETIRAYFNTHAFAINPARRLLGRWFDCFAQLVEDQGYQTAACQDVRHQIFLHQAVLSALLVAAINEPRLRILPPTYNYPYNLHHTVPAPRRAHTLSELVCFTYEARSVHPDAVTDIQLDEPLCHWLRHHLAASQANE